MLIFILCFVLFAAMAGVGLVEAEIPPAEADVDPIGIVFEEKFRTVGDNLESERAEDIIADYICFGDDPVGTEFYFVEFSEPVTTSGGRFMMDEEGVGDLRILAIEVKDPSAYPLETADGRQMRCVADLTEHFAAKPVREKTCFGTAYRWDAKNLSVLVVVNEQQEITRYLLFAGYTPLDYDEEMVPSATTYPGHAKSKML